MNVYMINKLKRRGISDKIRINQALAKLEKIPLEQLIGNTVGSLLIFPKEKKAMKMKKIVSYLLIIAMGASLLTGCGNGGLAGDDDPARSDDGRIRIKVQYISGRMNMDLESVLEEKFPELDIITDEVVGDHQYIISKEMEYDMEPDIYLYEGLKSMDDAVVADKLYDLSQESFTNKYYLSAISDCVNNDGGLYYLPGPIYIYGIVYDKTAFQKLGLSVPNSYSEFVQLLDDVKAMNLKGEEPDENDPEKSVTVDVRPFVPTLKWPDMWTIFFDSYNYDEALRGTDNAIWLRDYQNGNASMIGHMEGAAEKFLKLFDDGIISTDLWEMRAPTRTSKLYRYHTSLMTVECQSALGYNERENEGNCENMHEIGMMPFYTSDKDDSDYLVTMPRCFFGMTKKAAANEEKKEAILKIFDYFSTVEGQDLLIEGGGGEINMLKDSVLPAHPFYDDVRETMEEGRTVARFNYAGKTGAVESYMHETTPKLVEGSMTIKEWLEGADRVRDEALEHKAEEPVSYGTVEKTLSVEETSVIVGEAYIHETGADIGIVPCQGNFGMKNRLFEGAITDKTINTINTMRMATGVATEDMGFTKIVVVDITGEQLRQLLNSYTDVYVGTAGLDVKYAPGREAGERYVSLKCNGKEIKPDDRFTAAIVRGAAKDLPVKNVCEDLVFSDMFTRYLDSIGGTISNAPDSLKIVK